MGSVRTTLWALSWVPVAVTATQVIGQPIRVQGRSMQPALNPDSSLGRSDLVFVQKYGLRAPDGLHRGDVILLRSPTEPNRVLVKRILGTAGDTVRPRPTSQYPKQKVKIPTNHLWVEGDYIHSLDSNDFGPISKGLVLGKVRWILWPFNRWGPVMDRAPDGRVTEDS